MKGFTALDFGSLQGDVMSNIVNRFKLYGDI